MSGYTPSTPENADAAQVLRRFRVVFNAVRTHFRQVEKESGLGGAQVWALSLIRSQPGMGVGDVAKGMDTHQSTSSNLVKLLVKKQLVTMTKSLEDKRVVELRITPAGQAVLAQIPGPFEGVLPGALGQLDASTLARLNRDLGQLIGALHADESAGHIPLANL
ncbi:MAG: winged helix-turn-helix transcriptional regulator [Rhodoferax sp.]|uniref:MarR family winged helix-turn-helix transcriptional regulator n=1 Tax=Rhodoferax sp. TaxID=50421 RepID=UPI001B3E2527|nr:MarR family winged helix-turn-helix transcriptional regulator [Rhodoferax sp.]MBP9907043.1 winged helix-turn-helix transcriptional regulator [Rhodoferax sp.]